MAHVEERNFCKLVKQTYPYFFKNKKVLDIGSLDINGNNRFLFKNCEYLGLDVGEGPNVDVVTPGHLYGGEDESFDVIISTEVFEHDMFYEKTIKNIIRMLKPNGIFIFTCGGEGRPEHGTTRQGEFCAPLLQQISEEWANYYKNLTKNDIVKIDNFSEVFPDGFFLYNPYPEIPSDLYFFGVKGGFNDKVDRDEIFTNEIINSYRLSSLDEIANRHNTDKGSNLHDYCKKYEKYLKFNREEPINIMEIGVLGGSSLKMWNDYYYNSNILGIDINPDSKQHEGKNINVEIGSQNDINFLNRIANQYGKFDLIIDDGSHNSSDVITSFENLFYSLNSGGVYVVEDSCTSYWKEYEGGYKLPSSTIEYFKNIVDEVNYLGQLAINHFSIHARKDDVLDRIVKEKGLQIRTDIESINFINSIIIITKK